MDLNRVNVNNLVMRRESLLETSILKVNNVDLGWGTMNTEYEDGVLAEDISGIPLTKEVWGCIYSSIPYTFIGDAIELEIISNDGSPIVYNFQYLHELQNLYKLLEGEELVVNINELKEVFNIKK